MMHCVANLI